MEIVQEKSSHTKKGNLKPAQAERCVSVCVCQVTEKDGDMGRP